jgi:hypothetical protein
MDKNMIDMIFGMFCNTQSDINEHLPVLKKYSTGLNHIVEMGVRGIVSTWAFLSARPKKLTSIDIEHPSKYGGKFKFVGDLNLVETESKKEGIEFNFIQGDTTKLQIDECDLLFLDTWHVYDQLKIELNLHGNKAKKFIILHDTETFGTRGETPGYQGLIPAIEEFLNDNKHWKIKEIFKNNNGLTILERIN